LLLITIILFYSYLYHHKPPSFPTRRSSDLSMTITLSQPFNATSIGLKFNFTIQLLYGTAIDPSGTILSPNALQLDCEVEFQADRSEEHTSELQSRENLVCRLLLEKKKNITN